MPHYFYADCVITDIKLIPGAKTLKAVSAKIDGRQVKNLIISKEMQLYFAGLRGEAKSRVWFSVVSVFGKKVLNVQAVQTEAGERHVETYKARHVFYDVVIRAASGGFLAWLATWIIGFIPAAMYTRNAMESLYDVSLWVGIPVGIWMSLWTMNYYQQLSKTESWPEGDVSNYSEAVKPAFGSSVIGAKNTQSEKPKPSGW